MARASVSAPRALSGDELKALLWMHAALVAAEAGMTFEPGCEFNLRNEIAAAVPKIIGGSPLGWEQEVRDAVYNTEKLVRGMVREAQTQNATTLHEWSLTGALTSLCPLFPFCS